MRNYLNKLRKMDILEYAMPKNTESRLIAGAVKLLPPRVRLLMSFADESRGHRGTIYQATNFGYFGMTAGGKMLVTEDGIEKHPRLLGIYRMRHPETYGKMESDEIMRRLGYTYKEAGKKHRYARALGPPRRRRKDAASMAPMTEAYPQ